MRGLRRLLSLAVLAFALTSCGGATTYEEGGPATTADDAPAAGGHAGHGASTSPGATSAPKGGTTQPAGGMDDMPEMEVLAATETADLSVELHAMPPELFYVSEGDSFRPQRPGPDDDVHLMAMLADRESGVRLPDATVTARVVAEDGSTAFEGPLYPMVAPGMGIHYGENVPLGPPGRYTIELTIGPPRIGRHRSVRSAWSATTRVEQAVAFDGREVRPG